jgi:hypothetical protein
MTDRALLNAACKIMGWEAYSPAGVCWMATGRDGFTFDMVDDDGLTDSGLVAVLRKLIDTTGWMVINKTLGGNFSLEISGVNMQHDKTLEHCALLALIALEGK